MKKISAEKLSILLASFFTLLIFCIFFCTNFIKFNNKKIITSSSKMGNGNLLQLKIISDQDYKTKNEESRKNTINKINSNEEEKNNFTEFQNIDKNINNKEIKDNLINEELKSGNGNFVGENIGTSKILIDDIIDKKIQENIFFPEKAKQRGIEGKIILSITISKTGELLNYEILTKNESKIIIESSKQIIEKIFPIEEIQNHNLTENLSTQITFIYKLN